MPKQLRRGHAARNVTLQVPDQAMHSRHLHDVVKDAADTARLRGVRTLNDVALHTQGQRDTVIRRLFSRDDILGERAVVRAALARAAMNVTPERLGRLGSPGRQAVLTLQHASGIDVRHDVKAGQIRKAAALLAGGLKKQSFRTTPLRLRSSRLAQTGANALAAGGARRVQLRKFCTDSAVTRDLPALLSTGADQPDDIAACIAIFRSAAVSCILAEMKGCHADQKKMMRQLQVATDSPLLRLFLLRWMRAKVSGRLDDQKFPWVEAVDWLVRELRDARPLSPGATRAPRSPRVASPKPVPALPPAKPVRVARRPPAATQSPSAPGKLSAPSRSFAGSQTTVPAYVLAPPVPLQSGRQAISRRVQSYLESPTRLADGPAPKSAARRRERRQAHFSAMRSASEIPVPATVDKATAAAASASQAVTGRQGPVRAKTLLDIVMQEYEASLASTTNADSTASSADSQTAES
jgi:hypothetical protein